MFQERRRRRLTKDDIETEQRIFFFLVSSKDPLTKSEIAKRSKMTRQLVNYHLPKLVEKGVVLFDGDNLYMSQPFFSDLAVQEEVDIALEGLLNIIIKNSVKGDRDINMESMIYNNLVYQLFLFYLEIEKYF